MPKPGFHSITISENTKTKLDDFGKKTNRRGYDDIICELMRKLEEDSR